MTEQRRAPQVSLEDFVEVATAAALRAVEAANLKGGAASAQAVQVRGRPGLIIGIIIDPTVFGQARQQAE